MKTTEVVVEHVLIGLMVLAIGILPFACTLPDVDLDLFSGAVLLGGAYLVGILTDRVLDSLLQDIEQHNRLRFAFKKWKDLPTASHVDPFPEDKLKIWISAKGYDLADYANYLRTRIRLSRAIAVMAPGISISLLLNHLKGEGSQVLKTWGVVGVLIFYLIVVLFKLSEWQYVAWKWPYKPPKTNLQTEKDKQKLKAYYDDRGYRYDGDKIRKHLTLRDVMHEPVIMGLLLVTMFGLALSWIGIGQHGLPAFVVLFPVAGLGLSLLAGWVWWRVTKTFMTFLSDYERFGGEPTFVEDS